MNPSTTMLLITHTPRSGADAREYERWLQGASAFFNALPTVVHHSSWRIIANKLGAVPYSYCDYMFVTEENGISQIWADPAVQDFIKDWNDKWLMKYDDDERALHILGCTEVVGSKESKRTSYVLYLPHTPRSGAREDGFEEWLKSVDGPVINRMPEVVNYSGWRVDEATLGKVRFSNFDLIYVEGPDGYEKLYGNPKMLEHESLWIQLWGAEPDRAMGENFCLAVAECVASPDPSGV